jgi:D-3-phosphoglycerate dehydrogenase
LTNACDILVTLSTFGEYSRKPVELLEQSGLIYETNPYGRRMKPAEVVNHGGNCRALVAGVETYDAETLGQLPNLRCISRCGTGIDSIDLAEAARRGIAVLNTPDEPTIAVAELTLAMMLALLRQLPKVDALMHEGKWQRVPGNLLHAKTVGIIGLGRIGRRVAEIVQAFGAYVIGAEPFPENDWIAEQGVELVDLRALLARADIVSIHAGSSGEHPFKLGAKEIARMKPGALLINMARGDLVDDIALDEALASGHLAGAGLDVFPQEPYSGPLCSNPRAILSPHQATLTIETRVAMEVRAVENAIRFLKEPA